MVTPAGGLRHYLKGLVIDMAAVPFAALRDVFEDLDGELVGAGDDQYQKLSHKDGGETTVQVDPDGQTARIARFADGVCQWRITLTVGVPDVTQVVALYGALNPDPMGVVESIEVQYGLRPWADSAPEAAASTV